ncbi:cell division protein SepF [Gordonia paraffinivorans]|uniref:cell division protein SepF n=1 Tax=Gordonia paraffinivorans TaxID=175628 RepID=UPI000D6228DD|nr:cell division protein SepF [Gordonia paraffinivorans]MCD2144094.1 cell division protein SepF [Gordonia paraffinivorans]PWD43883.1 cell division protein SepF [Gordonia paraffinivorans]
MTTMQKFKAYFGMVPPSEYEDDYLEEAAPSHRPASRERVYRDEYYGDSSYDAGYESSAGYRDEMAYDDRFEPAYEMAGDFAPEFAYAAPRPVSEAPMRPSGRLEPLQRSSSAAIRAASSRPVAEHRDFERVFPEGPLQKITTLRPSDYSEARTIGERFRDGNPVIMDLVDMSNDDAKRLVDFAAGLAFALRGSFDKVATKVFLLSPADVDVSPEDRRKIAETGFYNHA